MPGVDGEHLRVDGEHLRVDGEHLRVDGEHLRVGGKMHPAAVKGAGRRVHAPRSSPPSKRPIRGRTAEPNALDYNTCVHAGLGRARKLSYAATPTDRRPPLPAPPPPPLSALPSRPCRALAPWSRA